MPLFRRVDPGPRDLIAYVVAAARARGITLTRTKLVKLLYLIDVERVRSRREPLTGFDWLFFHYGPYAYELIDTLESMEQQELVATTWNRSILYRGVKAAPDADAWPAGTKMLVEHVIEDFGPLELNPLLDHVYFHTEPMRQAQRGQRLDLSLAHDDLPVARRPLAPKAAPEDVGERLAAWRAKRAERVEPVKLDPPASFLRDETDVEDVVPFRGRLHVESGTEL